MLQGLLLKRNKPR